MPHYPSPNNPQVCKVSLIFQRDTRVFVNTYHVKQVAGWNLAKMQQVANDFKQWYISWFSLALCSPVALTGIQVRLLNPASPLAYDLPISPAIPGGRSAGQAEAGNVTVTTSWRTGLAGKAYRGRDYLPGIGESDATVTDTITSALSTLLAQAATHLISGAFTDIVELGVFHRPGLLPKLLDNTITDVVTAVIENIIDSQRRRLPGRGR